MPALSYITFTDNFINGVEINGNRQWQTDTWDNTTVIYVLRGDELVLGPFQGQPACVHIPVGNGVCGTAAATLETQRVADVHAFPGHIACDAASRSEIVVPLLVDGSLVGVLDIDSPSPDRFSENDQAGIERLCATYCGLQSGREGFL